jgi:hypothetical protein
MFLQFSLHIFISDDGMILEGTEDLHVNAPKLVNCEEDDDFVNMFDKMMNDNLNENKVVPRSQQLNIVAPVHLRSQPNKKAFYGKFTNAQQNREKSKKIIKTYSKIFTKFF